MKTLTIRGVPEALGENLKRRAVANRRSLNQEVLSTLEEALRGDERPSVEETINQVREFRARWKVQPMSPEEIEKAAEEGRA